MTFVLVGQVNIYQQVQVLTQQLGFSVPQTLDSSDLSVVSVTANGQPARFSLGPKHSFKGTPLEITLPFDLSR